MLRHNLARVARKGDGWRMNTFTPPPSGSLFRQQARESDPQTSRDCVNHDLMA